MPERWLNFEQLHALTEWSKRTVQQKVKDGAVRSRRAKTRAANGKWNREYDLFSLSPALQVEHAKAIAPVPSEIIPPEKKTAEIVVFAPRHVEKDAPRMPVSQEHQEQIEFRAAIVAPLLEFLRLGSKNEKRAWCRSNGYLFGSSDSLAQQIGARHGISRATIWRWVETCRSKGAQELFDRTRSDKGTSRWFARYPEAGAFVAYAYLVQRLSVRAAWRALDRDASLLGIPEDDRPSYETIRAAVTSIPAAWRILAREGEKKYREMCAPYLSRGYSEASNFIWVSDHCICDVEVMNDCFPEQSFGAPIRLRLTAILDFRARYVVGYSFAWEGSSRSIGTALRHAIMAHGPCEVFYCDNGKDYLKVAKGASSGYLRESPLAPEKWFDQEITSIDQMGILARLGIAVTHCIVRHPQSKHVERFFRTMHEQFDRRWWTYTGGSPDRRPDLAQEAMAEHRKLQRHGEVEKSRHPRASVYIAAFANYLNEYHNREHGGRGMDGRSPLQVFEQERNPRQRPVPAEDELAPMLMSRETRTVQECAVRLGKERRRYVPFDGRSLEIMHSLNRAEVVVGFDENDPQAIVVLDNDGRLLTWLRAETYVTQSSVAAPAIARSMQERRHLEKEARATLHGIARTARAAGARSEVEHMVSSNWQMTPAVSDFITRGKAQSRPDKTAVAPPSAMDITRDFFEEESA
jgi:putative transposase